MFDATGSAAPRERVLQVQRTARWFEAGGAPGETEVLWYVLHGYGELASDVAARVAFLASPARRVVVPEGLSRFYLAGTSGAIGASWMTRAAREAEIEDYVGYLDAVHARMLAETATDDRMPEVTLIGFSQGTATACRWVAFGDVRVARLILWGGAVPPDVDVEGDRDDFVGLSYVVGDRDPYVTPARIAEERARIEAAGLMFRIRTFAGGHRLDDGMLRDLALV
jgi:predicted esterase